MKTIKNIATAAAIITLTTSAANAQDLKFAHIDSQKVLSELPEYTAAGAQLQEEAKKLEDQLRIMTNEIQQKYQEYVSKRDSLPELIRATKEKELQDSNDRIQSYQQLAQQSLQQKEQQLLTPVIEKFQQALDAVGKENGFIYILDVTSQVVLYHSEQSTDAAPLVKAKLGVK